MTLHYVLSEQQDMWELLRVAELMHG
jgi:hypothetical protein